MREMIEPLEKLYFPILKELASDLSKQYSMLKCVVSSTSIGSETPFQGHSIGIECIFPESVKEQADLLSFSFALCHLNLTPKLMVDIVWGYPSGHIEWALSDCNSYEDWPDVTPALLEQVAGIFPDLCQLFAEIIHQHYAPWES